MLYPPRIPNERIFLRFVEIKMLATAETKVALAEMRVLRAWTDGWGLGFRNLGCLELVKSCERVLWQRFGVFAKLTCI